MQWTISNRLKDGDEFMCCWHRCRVTKITERTTHYSIAEIELIGAVPGAHKGANGVPLPIPPMVYGGRKVSEGWSPTA